jgi:hypothetical protein
MPEHLADHCDVAASGQRQAREGVSEAVEARWRERLALLPDNLKVLVR